MKRLLLSLLILLSAVISSGLSVDNSIEYGSVAGAIYPPFDAVNLTGYVILTPLTRLDGDIALKKASDVLPIYIRRMFKGRILCDSIPTGFYEASLNGVAYDSNFKVAATCVELKFIDFRVAPDSISVLSARLRRKANNKKETWKMPWPEIILPDTSDFVRIKGLYPNQAYDRLYNDVTLKKNGFLFTIEPNLRDSSAVDGLNLAVFSNKFYHGPDNELELSYNVSGRDIVIAVDVLKKKPEHEDYQYRQPVFKLINIPLSPANDRILFIGSDTSVYKIEIDSLDVNLIPVQEGKITQYKKPTYSMD